MKYKQIFKHKEQNLPHPHAPGRKMDKSLHFKVGFIGWQQGLSNTKCNQLSNLAGTSPAGCNLY